MSRPRYEGLEILSAMPPGDSGGTPLLFIHGAYTAAWCWQEHFLAHFAEAGYPAYALSLSGHGRSRGREHLDSLSIRDYVRDVAEAVEQLGAPPVLIGHSMGGFVVQKYLESHAAAGAALVCSVPPQGLATAAFGLLFSKPGLLTDLNRIMGGGKAGMESLKDALFAQPVDTDDLTRFYRWSQRESHRAIWDMTLFNLPRASRVTRVPLLVLGAELDHLIPVSLVEMTASTYRSKAEIFPGMGHGVMLERDWRVPADRILRWLKEEGL